MNPFIARTDMRNEIGIDEMAGAGPGTGPTKRLTPPTIPKVIYFCNKTLDKMQEYANNWKKLNPEYTIKLYDNAMCRAFLCKEYGSLYGEIFDFLQDGPIKADLWRACILYTYGGVYSDIDNQPFVPIKHFLEKNVDFLTCSSYIHYRYNPNFIISIKQNIILKRCIDWYVQNYRAGKKYSYWDWSIMYALSDTLFLKNYDKKEGLYVMEECMMEDILIIGPSETNVKTVIVDTPHPPCKMTVNKSNWANNDQYDDVFNVVIKNGKCTVTRTDTSTGWGIPLKIRLSNAITPMCIGPSKTNNKRIPLSLPPHVIPGTTFPISRRNWLNGEYYYGDTFQATFKKDEMVVRRMDTSTGWDKDVQIFYSYIHIGPSKENVKKIKMEDCPPCAFISHRRNWLNVDNYDCDDVFHIEIKDGICTVTRLDEPLGWDVDLLVYKSPVLNMTIQILQEHSGRNHYDSHNTYEDMRIFNNRYESWDCSSHSFR